MPVTPPRSSESLAGALQAGGLEAVGQALSASGVAAFVTGAAGTILWANQAGLTLAGAESPDALAGCHLDDLLVRSAARAGDVDPIWDLRPHRDRHFRVLESPLVFGEEAGLLHLASECTSEVARDEERRQREIYLARAAEDTLDAMISLDTEGRIRTWNRGAERMFGYRATEVCGLPYDRLLVPADLKAGGELERMQQVLARDGAVRSLETTRLARGGVPIQVELTVTPLRDEAGNTLGRSVIYRDITPRLRLEAELRENLRRLEAVREELSHKVNELRSANLKIRREQEKLLELEKLSAIGEMAAKVAHELRTPLVTIGGFANTLWKQAPEASDQRRYLGIIKDEVRRLETIVAEMLEYVRPADVPTEPCDVNALVEEALRPHLESLESGQVAVRRDLAEDLPRAVINRHQMLQVMNNLILNAAQSMRPGAAGNRLTVATAPGENHVRIMVADTGCGIPSRNRERIFRPFFTTRPGGTGLGLAISAQIVARNNATLTFESAEGQGTTFSLCLPTRREAHGQENDSRRG